jgi:hypothetical protein
MFAPPLGAAGRARPAVGTMDTDGCGGAGPCERNEPKRFSGTLELGLALVNPLATGQCRRDITRQG